MRVSSHSHSASRSPRAHRSAAPVRLVGLDDHVERGLLPFRRSVAAGDPNRLANLGMGQGGIDDGLGYTYLDAVSGRAFSIVGGLTYNFENPDKNYTLQNAAPRWPLAGRAPLPSWDCRSHRPEARGALLSKAAITSP